MQLLITVIGTLGACISTTWFACSLINSVYTICRQPKPRFTKIFISIFRYPALIGLIIQPAVTFTEKGQLSFWDLFWTVWSVLCWWMANKDSDDDDYDRMKDRLKKKVAEIEGRLVIVPVNA